MEHYGKSSLCPLKILHILYFSKIHLTVESGNIADTGYLHAGRADKDSYPHDCRADKDSYPHDGRADKDSYPHDRHKLTNTLCLVYNNGYRLALIYLFDHTSF